MSAATEQQHLRDVQARQSALNALEKPTLGDLAEAGVFSYCGRLANPTGWWHCPACWMDYATHGQYQGAKA